MKQVQGIQIASTYRLTNCETAWLSMQMHHWCRCVAKILDPKKARCVE